MRKIGLLLLILVGLAQQVCAGEWQYSVPISGSDSRAWLWIPPTCKRVKGIVMAQQVILDKYALESPIMRKMAEENDLAFVLVNPMIWTPKTGNESLTFINELAQISGYHELAIAPILTLGHSGGAIWAWHAAYCYPERIVAAIGLHAAPIFAPEWSPKLTLDGVPVLSISGQYETWDGPHLSVETHWRWVRGHGIYFRSRYPNTLFTEVVEPGCSHFSFSDRLAELVAMYISKAFKYRVVENEYSYGQPVLRRIPVESGWLTDTKFMTPNEYPSAPYQSYKGDKSLAFWAFDEEMAHAIENFGNEEKGKKAQWLTLLDKGKPVPNEWLETLSFEPVGDGMTMKVAATFLDKVPAKIKEGGAPVSHANGPIHFKLIGGWEGGGEQLNDSTFRIRFSNFGQYRRADNLMLLAYQEGDGEHAYTEQPAQIKYPVKNSEGQAQQITFPQPSDVKKGAKQIILKASASSGLPVEYYVKYGPATLVGNVLTISPIPARSKYPVEICVGAYQWGRSIAPKVQSAAPVEKTFYIR
jgi:hypothetical protein